MHSDIPSHILFGFPRAHGANAKRIKSMGAKGWRGKLGGDTWGPTILSLPVLPTGLKKHVLYATFREIAVQVFFGPFAFVHLSLEKILVEGRMLREWNPWGAEGWRGKIGGWHLGTHDFIPTTASYLPEKTVLFNFQRDCGSIYVKIRCHREGQIECEMEYQNTCQIMCQLVGITRRK